MITNIKTNNLYLFTLGVLFVLYTLNTFYTIYNIKSFMFVMPFIIVISTYNYIYGIKLNQEIKILLYLLLYIVINQLLSIFSIADLNLITFFNARWFAIILILTPLCWLYKKNYKLFDIMIMLAILVTILSNLFIYLFIYDFKDRFIGTFEGPNEFALLILFMIYYVIFYAHMYSSNKIKKIYYVVTIALLNFLMLTTLSRAGIITLIIFYLFLIKNNTSLRVKLMLTIVIILFLVYGKYLFPIEFNVIIEKFTSLEGLNALQFRIQQLFNSLQVITDNPLFVLFGTGTGSTSDIYWFVTYHVGDLQVQRTHNSIMSLLIENGIIGLSIYTALHICILRKIIKLKDKFKYTILGLFIGISLISLSVYTVYFLPYWLSLIMIYTHTLRLKEK